MEMKRSLKIFLITQWNRECQFLFLVHSKDDQSKDQTEKTAPNTRLGS